METSFIPENYQQWRHCILVECGLELTEEYIVQRIIALQDESQYYTQQFTKLYGPEYLQKVITWFQQAQANL